ncbi:MAG: hypothetical protein FWD66_09025 [Paludibacter sp.]|nr:hypothetical protein [Paludibacter sp.]
MKLYISYKNSQSLCPSARILSRHFLYSKGDWLARKTGIPLYSSKNFCFCSSVNSTFLSGYWNAIYWAITSTQIIRYEQQQNGTLSETLNYTHNIGVPPVQKVRRDSVREMMNQAGKYKSTATTKGNKYLRSILV